MPFRHLDPPSLRRRAREWGVTYALRPGETEETDTGNEAPQRFRTPPRISSIAIRIDNHTGMTLGRITASKSNKSKA